MIFDKVVKGIGKGIKTLAHGTKVLATNIMIRNAISKKKNQLKRVLLNRFTVRQLEDIAAEKNIRFRGVDPITGEKWVAKSKAAKVKILAQHLSFEEVIRLARRYKVKYKDIIEELDRFKASLEEKYAKVKHESKTMEIVYAIQEFKPEPVKDEEDLEKQLYQYLKAKFPKIKVERQKRLGPLRIDLYVPPCGIELKIPKNATHLQRLIGQIRDYSEYLDCLIAVILDTGSVRLASYTTRLEVMGIIPIIVPGKLKT
jgi:hypothetical protein